MRKKSLNKGFTLVEIMLYFTIVSIFLFAMMNFAIEILFISQKSSTFQEIETNIEYIVTKITSQIQNAESVNTPESIFDNDIGKLALNVSTPSRTPTSFYMQNEMIYIKEGSGTEIKINSDLIKCVQLKFSRIIQRKVPDQIVVDIKCEPINTETANLNNEQLKIHTSISLRK